MTEKFWFLSQLFVRPKTQAKGIGQALLSKTLMQAERNGATNRALITPAYNIASTGLYLNNGLYPREPLYRMAAPAQALAKNLANAGYETTPITPWPEPGEWTRRIDQELLGYRRDFHHKFLLGGFAAHAIRIERTGRAAGYAYISAQGHVGPLAIAPDADAKAVVTTALCWCAGEQAEPSHNNRSGTGGCRHAGGIGARVPHRRALCPDGVAAFWQLVQLSAGRAPGFL
jgi:hypothetical protein